MVDGVSQGGSNLLTKLFFFHLGLVVVWSEQEKWECLFVILGVVGGGSVGSNATIVVIPFTKYTGKKVDPYSIYTILLGTGWCRISL